MVLQSRYRAHNAFSDLVLEQIKAKSKELERLRRFQDEIRKDLATGSISKEQAEERLERIEEDSEKVDKKAFELLQLMAQLNRDHDATLALNLDGLKEMGRLNYDFHKHFTTLGTGSILFIAAIVRVIFPEVSETEGLGLLFTSFALLVASVIMAAIAMKGSTVSVVSGESSPRSETAADRSWFLFIIGITTFLLYIGINLAGVTIENEWSAPLYVLGSALLGALLPLIIRSVRSGVHKVWQFASKKRA